jgi:putative addiction module component (TIGR02574 family)
MKLSLEQFGIDRLTPQERWELIGLIWNSLPEDAPLLTPPDWHLRELQRRVNAAETDGAPAEPWADVLARLERPE